MEEVTGPDSLPRACKVETGRKVGPLMSCNIPVRDLGCHLALPPNTHSLGPRVQVGVSNNPSKECIGTHQETAWPDLMGLGPDGCQVLPVVKRQSRMVSAATALSALVSPSENLWHVFAISLTFPICHQDNIWKLL